MNDDFYNLYSDPGEAMDLVTNTPLPAYAKAAYDDLRAQVKTILGI